MLNDAERFFFANAGYSWDHRTETENDGRERMARRLAAAEATMLAGPYFIGVTPDEDMWDGDCVWDGPLWVVTLYQVGGLRSPEIVSSLGGGR